MCLTEHENLDLIVENEHQGATSAAENVGEGALEEGTSAFVLGDLLPAVDGASVHDFGALATRLHHKTTTDSVEGIRDDARHGGHALSNSPREDEACALGVGQHALGCVVEAEEGSAVDDDTLDGHAEALVETTHTISLEDLHKAVTEAVELTLASTLADISSKSGTGKVKRVDEAEGGGTSGTAGGEVTGEELPELGLLVNTTKEDLLVLVLEGEVERLCGEVTDDVGEVASPVGEDALFLGDADEAVDHALVGIFGGDLF